VSHVLFVCIQNAGRSQIAQAFLEQMADGRHQARSAGRRPAPQVHPEVVQVMAEVGIDVSANVPRKLNNSDMEWADLIVTMGCGDECPYIPGKRYIDWSLTDPAGRRIDIVRGVRDEIRQRVIELTAELTASAIEPPANCW
jgi:arsenate reductase (thioredoxin)